MNVDERQLPSAVDGCLGSRGDHGPQVRGLLGGSEDWVPAPHDPHQLPRGGEVELPEPLLRLLRVVESSERVPRAGPLAVLQQPLHPLPRGRQRPRRVGRPLWVASGVGVAGVGLTPPALREMGLPEEQLDLSETGFSENIPRVTK